MEANGSSAWKLFIEELAAPPPPRLANRLFVFRFGAAMAANGSAAPGAAVFTGGAIVGIGAVGLKPPPPPPPKGSIEAAGLKAGKDD